MRWTATNATVADDIVFSLSSNVADSSEVAVELVNDGKRAGRQTLLMFWRPKHVDGLKLKQKLIGYRGTGVVLAPGQRATMRFPLSLSTFELATGGSSKLDDETMTVAKGDYEISSALSVLYNLTIAAGFISTKLPQRCDSKIWRVMNFHTPEY